MIYYFILPLQILQYTSARLDIYTKVFYSHIYITYLDLITILPTLWLMVNLLTLVFGTLPVKRIMTVYGHSHILKQYFFLYY